jgi:hypothetical protein
MDDFEEEEAWDEEEVQIEDLGAPRRGLNAFLFSCGEKWSAAARSRRTPVALACVLSLLLLLLLPGSTLLRPATSVSHSIPSTSRQTIICIDIIISPTAVTTWLRQVAPTSSGGVILHECGLVQSLGSNP